MRFYSFVAGLYLSDKQKAIQAGHVQGELSIEPHALYTEWVSKHKTWVMLNAHTSGNVKRTFERLEHFGSLLELPHAVFAEDEESLGGATTACGIIVPGHLYGARSSMPGSLDYAWIYDFPDVEGERLVFSAGTTEAEFCKFLRGFNLA